MEHRQDRGNPRDRERLTVPIYTYLCPACGNVFEELRSIADDSDVMCPIAPCVGIGGKIPSQVSRPQGGDTPIHFRNRRENR